MKSIVERRTFRLGVLMLAFVAISLWLVLLGPVGRDVWPWVILGVIAVVAIGLMVHARIARAVVGLGVAACGAIAPHTLISELCAAAPLDGWTPLAVLAIANAIATTALGVWLCVRAIQALLGRTWAPSLVTARLTGAVLAVAAANHLWLAAAVGARLGLSDAGFSMGLSTHGAQLAGFVGWPLWHLALAAIGLMMLAGPRRLVALAATLLVGWSALLVALVVLTSVVGIVVLDAPRLGMMLTTYAAFLAAVFAYLAWWLRDEIRRQDAAGTPFDPDLERQ
ncbi:MAG TPA: hypothetical protein VHW23_17855 [Kofleriaceae bacterium]|nr:hypothetical protein [Kofleriaceae bacterium]